MAIFLFVVMFAQNKYGAIFLYSALVLIFLPVILIYLLIVIVIANKQVKAETKGMSKEEIQERARLRKNGDVIQQLIEFKIDDLEHLMYLEQLENPQWEVNELGDKVCIPPQESKVIPNELSVGSALSFINRLPMENDAGFLLGITYKRDIYMVIPKPLGLQTEKFKKDTLLCYPLTVEKYNPSIHKEKWKTFINFFVAREREAVQIEVEVFEQFISPFRVYEFNKLFDGLHYENAYKEYVKTVHSHYFSQKAILLKQWDVAADCELPLIEKELNELIVGNEDIITRLKNGIAEQN